MVMAICFSVRSANSGIIKVLMSGVIFCTFNSCARTNIHLNALSTPLPRWLISAPIRLNSESSMLSGRFITVTGCAPPSKNIDVKRSRLYESCAFCMATCAGAKPGPTSSMNEFSRK